MEIKNTCSASTILTCVSMATKWKWAGSKFLIKYAIKYKKLVGVQKKIVKSDFILKRRCTFFTPTILLLESHFKQEGTN